MDERCFSGDGARVVLLLSSAKGVPARTLDKSHRDSEEHLSIREMLAYCTDLHSDRFKLAEESLRHA